MRFRPLQIITAAFFTASILLGCSGDELTRDTAESILRSQSGWPIERTIDFPLQTHRIQRNYAGGYDPVLQLVERAESAGVLASLDVNNKYLAEVAFAGSAHLVVAALNSEGERYVRGGADD